jgi:hypothetical protein
VPDPEGSRNASLPLRPDQQDDGHPKDDLLVLARPDPGGFAQPLRIRVFYDRVIKDQLAPSDREPCAQGQLQEGVPRPGAMEHTGQPIVGGAGKRVSYSRTGREVGTIQQRHAVYPQGLRHRVFPPQEDSMPFFMRVPLPA